MSVMQWVQNGPDVPNELVDAAESGDLAILCGAGVSRKADLPLFQELVEKVYQKVSRNIADDPLEKREFRGKNFDRVLGLLEQHIEKAKVRGAVADILHLKEGADCSTHAAIRTIATDREGNCHVVTTNFDRCFGGKDQDFVQLDAAPSLPIPKRGRWNSVVHLHGHLDFAGLDGRNLVLTSADFGAAYLTEGWASRFLAELIRNFKVLLVGYSADDLVVRYILEAASQELAERRARGTVFAFAEYQRRTKSATIRDWKAKGVEPILYNSEDKHALLHQTLRVWAREMSQGLLSRESIVVASARNKPSPPFESATISQLVWAIQDSSGSAARRFANLEPLPPVEWLAVFEREGLLERDGHALVSDGAQGADRERLNPVTDELGSWLAKQLGDRKVLEWVLNKGGYLHWQFRQQVRISLERDTIDETHRLRPFWELLAGPLICPPPDSAKLFQLREQMKRGTWNVRLKAEMMTLLQPRPHLVLDHLALMFQGQASRDTTPVDMEVHFPQAYEVEDLLDCIRSGREHHNMMTDLLDDVTSLIRSALEFRKMVAEPSSDYDGYPCEVSVAAEEPCNSQPWTRLVPMAAECLLSAERVDPVLARSQAERWRCQKYPVFRRLFLHAMRHTGLYEPVECLAALFEDGGRWLWQMRSCPEVTELVTHIWPKLSTGDQAMLNSQILQGPPREFYPGYGDEDFNHARDRAILHFLRHLQAAGHELPSDSQELLEKLCQCDLLIAGEERPIQVELYRLSVPNRIAFLLNDADRQRVKDTFSQLLTERRPVALNTLRKMADSGHWPVDLWTIAIEQTGTQTWAPIFRILRGAPRDTLSGLCHCLSHVALSLRRNATLPQHERLYWQMWEKLRTHACASAITSRDASGPDSALNSPVGYLTEALFEWWRETSPEAPPAKFWDRLESICSPRCSQGHNARVVASTRFGSLWRTNPRWTEKHLLPSLDWSSAKKKEAAAIWRAFLFDPPIDHKLWPRIKPSMLAAIGNRAGLATEAERLDRLFVSLSLRNQDWFYSHEIRQIVRRFDARARKVAAQVLWRELGGVGDRSSSLWKENIAPWINEFWPMDTSFRDEDSSEYLCRAAIAAGQAFDEAVRMIGERVCQLNHTGNTTYALLKTQHPKNFPKATLRLLGKIVNEESARIDPGIGELVDLVVSSEPDLRAEREFQDLFELLRRSR
ncbi:MAG: SIR2 family protein [Bryobacteraceae bacterium]|nr:SIR2 family protein [Bryobacteraceae bacterium]